MYFVGVVMKGYVTGALLGTLGLTGCVLTGGSSSSSGKGLPGL
jgi:hypothetical protein